MSSIYEGCTITFTSGTKRLVSASDIHLEMAVISDNDECNLHSQQLYYQGKSRLVFSTFEGCALNINLQPHIALIL